MNDSAYRLCLQTINIRKFLRELEQDAMMLDKKLQTSYGRTSKVLQKHKLK